MNIDTEDRLKTRFPTLLAHLAYFECGEGWAGLIEEALLEAERLALPGTSFEQVKEKLGTLRLYVSMDDDVPHADFKSFHGYLGMLEGRSRTVCEACGAPGETRHGAWIQTLCDEHANPAG